MPASPRLQSSRKGKAGAGFSSSCAPLPRRHGAGGARVGCTPVPHKKADRLAGNGRAQGAYSCPLPASYLAGGGPLPHSLQGLDLGEMIGREQGGAHVGPTADRIGRPKHIRAPRTEHSPVRLLHGTLAPATRNSRQGRRAEGAVAMFAKHV